MFAFKLNKNNKLHGEAFNFGPNQKLNYKVIELLKISKKSWKKVSWKITNNKKKNKHYESTLLKLNSNKALNILKWRTVLTFKQSLNLVINWYKSFYKNKKPISIEQIKYYEKIIRQNLKMKKITIIDYGCGNLLSLSRAIEEIGFSCHITSEKKKF